MSKVDVTILLSFMSLEINPSSMTLERIYFASFTDMICYARAIYYKSRCVLLKRAEID